MLILAAVSIATLTGENGILTQANQAKITSDIAGVKEQAQLDIATWTAERLKNGQDTTLDDATVKSIIEDANKDNSNKYYSELTDTKIITKQRNEILLSDLYTKTSSVLLASEALTIDTTNKISSYVNYVDKNEKKILCKVLYDADSDYGLQIVAVNPVDTVILGPDDPILPAEMASQSKFEKSKYSYNNAIKTLNDKAETYRNPKYTDENGARCVGSVPDNPSSESGYFKAFVGYTYMNDYNGIFKDTDSNYSNTTHNRDWQQLAVVGAKGITDITKSDCYWLASRFVESNSNYSSFFVRFVGSNGWLDKRHLVRCYVSWLDRRH